MPAHSLADSGVGPYLFILEPSRWLSLHLQGCGLVDSGGGGGRYTWSSFPTTNITRSWVALSVATASSCVTFSRFLSPC